VTRAGERLDGLTLDDPRLRRRGFMLYGGYRQPHPPAEIVRALIRGEIDVGLVWGPLAGHFAARSAVPLRNSVPFMLCARRCGLAGKAS
jgi:hypothetical protein